MQGRPRDGPPAQSGDHRMDLRRGRRIAQGKIDIVGELAAHADREALFDHDDMFSAGQQSAQRRGWERPERHDGHKPDAETIGTHLIDGVLDGAIDRTHGNHQHFRIVGAIGAQQATGIAPEPRFEFCREFRYQPQRQGLLIVLQEAHLGERIRPHHGADGNRSRGIKHLHRLIRRQERIDVGLIGHVHALDGMREDEAVDADHHWHRKFLGQPKRLNVQVDRILIGFRKQLHPAGVAHRHRIGMIVPDVDRRADGPIAERHHDRQAKACGVVDRLGHEQQALARGRGIGARAGRRRADRDREGGEFRFHIDKFAILQIARSHHLAEPFDNMGLRRDRIGADDFGAAQGNCLGGGVGTFGLLQHRIFLTPPS